MNKVKDPAPCRVKVIKCSYEQGWYRDSVGEEFDVDNAKGKHDYVIWEDFSTDASMWRHIKQEDCERVPLITSKNTTNEPQVEGQ